VPFRYPTDLVQFATAGNSPVSDKRQISGRRCRFLLKDPFATIRIKRALSGFGSGSGSQVDTGYPRIRHSEDDQRHRMCISASSEGDKFGLVHISVCHTQPLVHDRAGRRVLEVDFLVRLYSLFDRKCRKRCFVKTTQDEFFLSRIEVDVTDRIDSRL
jgi:hypothetical protein